MNEGLPVGPCGRIFLPNKLAVNLSVPTWKRKERRAGPQKTIEGKERRGTNHWKVKIAVHNRINPRGRNERQEMVKINYLSAEYLRRFHLVGSADLGLESFFSRFTVMLEDRFVPAEDE